jgi:hypothetical protein
MTDIRYIGRTWAHREDGTRLPINLRVCGDADRLSSMQCHTIPSFWKMSLSAYQRPTWVCRGIEDLIYLVPSQQQSFKPWQVLQLAHLLPAADVVVFQPKNLSADRPISVSHSLLPTSRSIPISAITGHGRPLRIDATHPSTTSRRLCMWRCEIQVASRSAVSDDHTFKFVSWGHRALSKLRLVS